MNAQIYDINGTSLLNVRNSYEIKVIKAMKNLLAEYDKCDGCSICLQDIYALSLSKIKPKYVQEGTIILKKDDDQKIIEKVVRHAIEKVIENPNHS
ncbi:MAG: late competence development ComFB family protein [Deltaproteobacteria bacterium]|jgi:hypothetical protein|nr:late competence development ComFB family protein [Deltaproteobacteria bacterium]MBT4525446.1 late competence development ComFB family protein [Deltaproteobacteria bacterium]